MPDKDAHNANDWEETADARSQFVGLANTNKKRRRRRSALFVIMVVILILAAILLVLRLLFSVRTIIIEGSEHYDYDSLLEGAGIQKKDFLLLINRKKVEKALIERFAYIENAELIFEYPSTVTIEVTEEEPSFYCDIHGEYYVFGLDMRVLERYTNYDQMMTRFPLVMRVEIPEVGQAIVSEQLVFLDETASRHVAEALVHLASWDLLPKLTSIDLTKRFDMRVVYEGRLDIRLGGVADLSDKLDFTSGIIRTYSQKAKGTIYVDNIVKAYALVDDPLK